MSGRVQIDRPGSSLESFLDDYQSFRLVVGGIGLVYVVVMVAGGWWQWGSPLPSLIGAAGLVGHAFWCRLRGIRSPRTILIIDTTLVGASLFSLPTPVMASFFGLLAIVVALFVEGWWRTGLLAYLTTWYVAAFLVGSTINGNSVRALLGTIFAVAAGVTLMMKLRTWMGRLDANRSQMLGTVSHELRNNLTGVLGLTEVVASMDDLEPAEATELLAMVHQQAIDATEIVEDLLTASRIERAVLTTSPEVVDINKEVETTARRFQGSGTEISLRLDNDLPAVSGDGLRIRQTLRNLVSNAIRYGGPEIEISTRRAGALVETTVRDNGDGVPSEDEKSIFLPYRTSTRGRRDAASVGLGLWICHQLARAMGGSLTYRRDGGWTQFELALPVSGTHLDPSPEMPSHPVSAAKAAERASSGHGPTNQSCVASTVMAT